ncbi:MAG TPA: PP2C family protein-serine/threonine phosphatase [Aquihabitans sp.]|nr:PP2C family protein-serine/threonine phosphatase [Aquihabitans sp.]
MAAGAGSEVGPRRAWAPVVVVLVGAIGVAVLATSAYQVQRTAERDQLRQRAAEASTALEAVLPVFGVPLASAVAVVDETDDDPAAFERVIGGFVGDQGLASSAALWRTGADDPEPVIELGRASQLAAAPAAERARTIDEAPVGVLGIVDLTDRPVRAIGFTLASAKADPDGRRAVAYLEIALPDDPTAIDLAGDAYDDLDSAIYLGDRARPSALLTATTRDLPLRGAEQVVVPWGDGELLLQFVPRGRLVGGLLATLPLIIAVVGGLLVAAFGLLAHRLQRTGRRASQLARANEALYLEQQGVAVTLQRQLLPESLPDDPRVELAQRYQAGVAGIEVGGDWYDAVLVDDGRRLVLTVGDVSGQGLPAATVMITLRIAVRAWASEGDRPAQILEKLDRMLDVRTDGHFATVLCAALDLATGRIELASAGHPVPVVARGSEARTVEVRPGLPIGVGPDAYQPAEVGLEPGDLLVAFTDGLFERRGEVVDDSMERVRVAVGELVHQPAQDVVDGLVRALAADEAPDDTAVLAVRWIGGFPTAPNG